MLRYRRYRQTASAYWAINRLVARAGSRALLQRLRHTPRQFSWSLRYAGAVELLLLGTPSRTPMLAEQIRNPLEQATALTRLTHIHRQPLQTDQWAGEWITAPHARTDRVILYLHGGGYVSGSPHSHRALMGYLSRHSGARVLALDYRLAPEHPFPAALEDGWAAYWWLLCAGFSAQHILVAGDSAGGGLALALLLALRDAHMPLPAGAICLSPWVDLALTAPSLHKNQATDYINPVILRTTAEMYLGQHDPHDPLASPLYADLHGLPPLLVQVGSAELLYDDGRRLAQRARRAGVAVQFEAWPGMVHVWHFLYRIEPKARQAVQSAGRFARRQWGEQDGRQETQQPARQPDRQRQARRLFDRHRS